MAEIQKQFDEFNEAIRLKQYEDNSILREKRDIVLRKLKERLKDLFMEMDKDPPKYTHFDQGSYKLGTAVKPLAGDFDIDVGLLFEVDRDEYPDPVEVSFPYNLDGTVHRIYLDFITTLKGVIKQQNLPVQWCSLNNTIPPRGPFPKIGITTVQIACFWFCFDRYNIVSDEDLKLAAQKQSEYLASQMGTISGTVHDFGQKPTNGETR